MTAQLTFRPGSGSADAVAASRIIGIALDDLLARQGRPVTEGPEDEAAPALAHVMRTDPDAFWIAADGDDPVGFGAGMSRGGLWFLSGLFVLPPYQGAGVGRRLLELAKGDHPLPGEVAALTSSAANPVSNALYSRHGIYPQLPVLTMQGGARAVATAARGMPGEEGGRSPGRRAPEAEPLTASGPHLDDLRRIDEAVTGVDRTVDHRWQLEEIRHEGWLLRRGGRPVGYAYLGGDGTEGPGALGPVATLRPQDQGAALSFALAESAARRPGEPALVMVPAANQYAQRLLWRAGFTFEGATALLCASRPFGRFDRYLLAGDCLM